MRTGRTIRVLVIDDSIVFREVISRGISSNPCIEVVAKAVDPFDARDKILEYEPDVVTCDIEMPRMNGIDFLRRLMPQYPIPVIVVSTISDAVFDAMNAGAVDFVTKPDVQSAKCVETFINELSAKIITASMSNVSRWRANSNIKRVVSNIDTDVSNKIIAIGASTGGTEAICKVLKSLPQDAPGIVITQHIPPVFSRMFAERLDNCTLLDVKEAKTGDKVERGRVLIAPGDHHMRIRKIGDRFDVECFQGDKVNGHCPSVDVLFESVAKNVGDQAIGIILTGMGYDGGKGLLSMRRKGARTIGQDQQTSVVYGMPKVAYDIGAVEKQVSLDKVSSTIYSFLNEEKKHLGK